LLYFWRSTFCPNVVVCCFSLIRLVFSQDFFWLLETLTLKVKYRCIIVLIYGAVGSENNSLYVYYKGLSKHLLTFKFDTLRSVMVRTMTYFLVIKPINSRKYIHCTFLVLQRSLTFTYSLSLS